MLAFSQFCIKEEVGRGLYGVVSTAEECNSQTDVIKKLLGQDREEQEGFVKEARLLHSFKSPNIICTSPFALVLEYAYFDFEPFGGQVRVSSLDQFLAYINISNCKHFDSKHLF